MTKPGCGQPVAWHGLYKGQTGLLVEASISHPAKMAPALCYRILEHLKELGLLKPDDIMLDPMAGTGMTGLCWATLGGKSIMVELEPKFIDFIQRNKEALAKKLGRPVEMEIVQGDARQLSQLLTERGLVVVSSPPYGQAQEGGGISARMRGEGKYKLTTKLPGNLYQPFEHGQSPGQIGSLPDRVIVTSPPYENVIQGKGSGIDWAKSVNPRTKDKREVQEAEAIATAYGDTLGQISQEQGETYLSAMRQVYAECLKVANVLCIVTKNPTRAGRLHRLDLATVALLEATGWEIVCQHRAILFEETEQGHLFEGVKKQPKGRLSFFKRLAYQKGLQIASHEDILFCIRP